ncbi:MAG: acyltransferase, partial [Culicoidibacterales bacterium]
KSSINGYVFLKNSNNKVSIGKFTTVVQFKVECEWGTDVDIGEDCMFSRDITIRTGDSHSIIDLNTNKRVNFPKSVFIGKHVWVGYGANIAKGSEIQQNSVIGAASYVNKVFKCGNVVIAGVPAKITKENITWDRRSLSDEIPERHIQNLKDRYLFVEQKS